MSVASQTQCELSATPSCFVVALSLRHRRSSRSSAGTRRSRGGCLLERELLACLRPTGINTLYTLPLLERHHAIRDYARSSFFLWLSCNHNAIVAHTVRTASGFRNNGIS